MAHVSTELLTNSNRTATNESLEFSVDTYRCGKCSMEFTLLEDFVCHKLLVEKNNIVLWDSEKISGLQIPRFVENHGDYLQNIDSAINPTEKNNDEIIPENLLNRQDRMAPASNTLAKKSQQSASSKKIKVDSVSDRATSKISSSGRKSNKVVKSLPQPNSQQLTSVIAKQRLNKHDPACTICGSIYRDFTTLKTHMKTVHSKNRPFHCGFAKCSCSFKTKASLQRHERRHTGERPFTCEQCGRTFRESGTLSRHLKARIPCVKKEDAELPRYGRNMSLVSDPSSKNVDKNGGYTASAETLQIIITQIPESADVIASHQQPEINKISSTGTAVDTNSTSQHQFSQLLEVASRLQPDSDQKMPEEEDEEDYVVVDPPYTLKPEMLRKALMQQFLEQNFHCIVCCNQYQQCSHLIHHIQQTHLKDYLHRCTQCFFVSKDRESLLAHCRAKHDRSLPTKVQHQESLHWTQEAVMQLILLNDILDDQERERTQNDTPKRNNGCHRCHVCLKKFRSRGYFALHMGHHTGHLPHSCDICQRAFISKDSLEKHLVTHSSQRTYKCEICDKLFKRLNHMKDHFKTHTNERHYFCKICGKGFKWPGALKCHELTHDRNVVFECESCDRRFKTRSTMKRHARRHQVADQASAIGKIAIQNALPCNENETNDLQLTTTTPDDATEEQPTYFFILEDSTLSLIPAGLLDTENLWRQSQQPSGAEQEIQESQ